MYYLGSCMEHQGCRCVCVRVGGRGGNHEVLLLQALAELQQLYWTIIEYIPCGNNLLANNYMKHSNN